VRRAQGPKPRAPPLAQIGRSTGRDGPPGGGGELSPAHPRPSPGRPSPARAPPALSRGTGWPDACAPAGARGGGTASGPASGPAGGRRGAQGAGRRGAPGGAGGRRAPARQVAAAERGAPATALRDGSPRRRPAPPSLRAHLVQPERVLGDRVPGDCGAGRSERGQLVTPGSPARGPAAVPPPRGGGGRGARGGEEGPRPASPTGPPRTPAARGRSFPRHLAPSSPRTRRSRQRSGGGRRGSGRRSVPDRGALTSPADQQAPRDDRLPVDPLDEELTHFAPAPRETGAPALACARFSCSLKWGGLGGGLGLRLGGLSA